MIDTNHPEAVAEFLSRYNAWRREGAEEMPAPAEIGKAIDAAVSMLHELAEMAKRKPAAVIATSGPSGGCIDWTGNLRLAVGAKLYIRPVPAEPVGKVVVSTDEAGRCVAVTRQDDEHRILSVIWEAPATEKPVNVQLLEAAKKALKASLLNCELQTESPAVHAMAGLRAAIAAAEAQQAGPVRLTGATNMEPAIIEGAPCRNALARDGKPYPKSSCQRCGTLLRSGWKCANGVEI